MGSGPRLRYRYRWHDGYTASGSLSERKLVLYDMYTNDSLLTSQHWRFCHGASQNGREIVYLLNKVIVHLMKQHASTQIRTDPFTMKSPDSLSNLFRTKSKLYSFTCSSFPFYSSFPHHPHYHHHRQRLPSAPLPTPHRLSASPVRKPLHS